jgi:hypothetical protein
MFWSRHSRLGRGWSRDFDSSPPVEHLASAGLLEAETDGGRRLLFVWLHRLFPSVLKAITIVQPKTIIRWHRMGFRLYWRWNS